MDNGQIILFQTQWDETRIEIRLANESVWLTADQMAELFQRNKSTISRHIKNIYESAELEQNRTVAFFATVQNEGDRKVERNIAYYNLDMIISVGYRVNSHRGVQFRYHTMSYNACYFSKLSTRHIVTLHVKSKKTGRETTAV